MTETRFRRRAAMRLGGPASPIVIRPRANPAPAGFFRAAGPSSPETGAPNSRRGSTPCAPLSH